MSAEDVRARREALRRWYRGWFERVTAILFEEDPIGLDLEVNTDEYEAEAETILPRLEACADVHAVRAVVHEEFVRWFDSITAGPPERYERIAARLWEELPRRRPPGHTHSD